MYADRYAKQKKLDPASLGLSALLVGGIMTGMIFSAPDFVAKIKDKGIDVINIALPPDPPLDPVKPPPETEQLVKPVSQPVIPDQLVTTTQEPKVEFTGQPDIPTTPLVGEGTVTPPYVEPVKPQPVIVGPGVNPRFNYQPDYPSDERRLGREGRVVVRVLVGTDGRVKQVEKVSAASESFFEATRRRALERWRLTPGTKDGVPVEAWRTMAVSFVMNDE